MLSMRMRRSLFIACIAQYIQVLSTEERSFEMRQYLTLTLIDGAKSMSEIQTPPPSLIPYDSHIGASMRYQLYNHAIKASKEKYSGHRKHFVSSLYLHAARLNTEKKHA